MPDKYFSFDITMHSAGEEMTKTCIAMADSIEELQKAWLYNNDIEFDDDKLLDQYETAAGNIIQFTAVEITCAQYIHAMDSGIVDSYTSIVEIYRGVLANSKNNLMNKQRKFLQNARDKMGWTSKPICCENCKHYTRDVETIKGTYGYYSKTKNIRCLKGGFATKPMSSCNEH